MEPLKSAPQELEEMVRSSPAPKKRRFTLWFWILLISLCIIVPPLTWGGFEIYERFFESTSPTITILKVPPGVGSSKAKIRIKVEDYDSGIDEIVVRIKQRAAPREIFRKKMAGVAQVIEEFDFSADDAKLTAGPATLIVRAFDRSLKSNSAEETVDFLIDYRKPRISALSSMHNGRIGGTQLIFYQLRGDNLKRSGVMVNNHLFLGGPAVTVDPELKERTTYAALYALDIREPSLNTPRLYAQNMAATSSEASFYNLRLTRTFRKSRANIKSLEEIVKLTPLNERTATELAEQSRFDLFPQKPFLQPSSGIAYSFGDEVAFMLKGQEVAKERFLGYLFRPPVTANILAANDGVIANNLDNRLVIDHGFGLSSIYYGLSSAKPAGQLVTRGDSLGNSKDLTDSRKRYYYELRLHGVPIDPREWWDEKWFRDHITKKTSEIKKLYGSTTIN